VFSPEAAQLQEHIDSKDCPLMKETNLSIREQCKADYRADSTEDVQAISAFVETLINLLVPAQLEK